ncbi:MAG TPA: DNA recombination/repair protein RecA, partial [Acidimicrobiia bacterium]|nr:DNA recombination/repair protein RecA [Acidimicrobiia bacterium]
MADKHTEKGAADREKALDMAKGQIEKNFGKGALMRLGDRTNVGVEAISTGAL